MFYIVLLFRKIVTKFRKKYCNWEENTLNWNKVQYYKIQFDIGKIHYQLYSLKRIKTFRVVFEV